MSFFALPATRLKSSTTRRLRNADIEHACQTGGPQAATLLLQCGPQESFLFLIESKETWANLYNKSNIMCLYLYNLEYFTEKFGKKASEIKTRSITFFTAVRRQLFGFKTPVAVF